MDRDRDNDDKSIAEIEAAFLGAYRDTQYHYVQFLTEHLADCASTFEGDLASVLILAVLGQRKIEAAREDAGRQTDVVHITMTTMRIADVSGIPRETVRRKLEALRKKGWIDRDKQYGWYVTGTNEAAPARVALMALEARSFRRLARLHARLEEILNRSSNRNNDRTNDRG